MQVYVIAGPTASGKTAVAIRLAKLVGGEVVSADSMQVYRGMDIGTAKPTEEEMQCVPHHLLNVLCPSEDFSAAKYKRLAEAAIADIRARGKVPILAGGTGFYINAVLFDADFGSACKAAADEMKSRLLQEAAESGTESLHARLREADPDSAKAIHKNNVRRVAAALAHFYLTGERLSAHNSRERLKPPRWETVFFLLDMPRSLLYERIDARALLMLECGLVEETERLIGQGFAAAKPMQGIGYKEAGLYIGGVISKDEMTARIQQATRNYAKRQVTWFKNQAPWANVVDARGCAGEIAAGISFSHGS